MSERARRWLRRTVLVVVLLVLVFHLGGGWYFAGQVGSEVLAVKPYPVVEDLTVTSVHGATITLRDPGAPDTELRSPGTYGVVWPGGYGQVSGSPEARAALVTRTWLLLSGRAPATGTRTHLDKFAFPLKAPSPATVIDYLSPVGQLPATYFPGTSTTWAILIHGKGATRAETYRLAAITSGLGMPTLSIGYRNDPGVPRDPSGRYRYGATEWRDLQGAVTWATKHGASDLVLGGTSMGGGIVASYLRHVPGQGRVKAVVLDSPMLNLRDTVAFGASQRSLGLGLPIPGTLVWSAEEIASVRYGVNWGQVNYTSKVDWIRVPTLVFHGTDDDTVPPSDSQLVAKESPDVRLVVVPGATHVGSWNVDPGAYDGRVHTFLKGVVG